VICVLNLLLSMDFANVELELLIIDIIDPLLITPFNSDPFPKLLSNYCVDELMDNSCLITEKRWTNPYLTYCYTYLSMIETFVRNVASTGFLS